jgi:maltose alpha-D-glucosyltransferase/alpha-amylase
MPQDPSLAIAGSADLLANVAKRAVERALPAFLLRQRWFGGKARPIDRVVVRDAAVAPELAAVVPIIELHYLEGAPESYFIPLVRVAGSQARARLSEHAQACCLESEDGGSWWLDATFDEGFCQWLLRAVGQGMRLPTTSGVLSGHPGRAFARLRGDESASLPARRNSADQSNTSVCFGDRLIMKLFRRLHPGPHPDCELTRYLSDERGNTHVPGYAGSLHYHPEAGEELTLGLLQNLVANEGDGWTWTLAALDRYYQACAQKPFPSAWRGWLRQSPLSLLQEELPAEVMAGNAAYLAAAATLARRTAEMHRDLAAQSATPALQTRRLEDKEIGRFWRQLRDRALRVLGDLERSVAALPDDMREVAASVLAGRERLVGCFRGLERLAGRVQLTRVHGDYHLGQVLRTGDDFVILDFEGEPARSLSERRSLQPPLKDVAGMLRSFSYAAEVAHANFVAHAAPGASLAEDWALLWKTAVSSVFLRSYRAAVAGTDLLPEQEADIERLLGAYLLDKALYELDYEINNRPAWARVPLLAIADLCRSSTAEPRGGLDAQDEEGLGMESAADAVGQDGRHGSLAPERRA